MAVYSNVTTPVFVSNRAALELFTTVHRFSLGTAAGAIGAVMVYPVDLVKTRIQNQRSSATLLYRNSVDCFLKVARHEGFTGLYKGLAPQLLGISYIKAMSLTINDGVRRQFKKADGSVPLRGQILAGCTAGFVQVLITNPLEIVKIRFQMLGETAKLNNMPPPKFSTIAMLRQIGLFKFYKGAFACFCRDIPFAAIYFTSYDRIKTICYNSKNSVSFADIVFAGVLAGIPAAFLTTPADVVKTRLQVKARSGETCYKGTMDCISKVWKEEGFKAFWKGSAARVCRSAPQYGITLLAYESLKKFTKSASSAVPSRN